MTHIIISSEGDMESGIEKATELAKLEAANLTLEFPSENFAKVFMENMFVAFIDAKVPKDSNMNLNVMFPMENDNEEEGFEFGS